MSPEPVQLAVGEHVAADEAAPRQPRVLVVRPGDAVVEQPALGAQPRPEEREVRRVVLHADVLDQPDRAHRVEVALAHVAVVAVAHLGDVVEALGLDALLGPGRLLAGERDAEDADAVVLRRVPDHAAPAAADVEQPHTGLQPDLAGDEVVLVRLRLLEGGVLGREARAGVGHRRSEHPLVERVRHVVVIADRLGVAVARVPQAAPPGRHDLLGGAAAAARTSSAPASGPRPSPRTATDAAGAARRPSP